MGRLPPAAPGGLKEIINRGGEKISPREVDNALLRHASVEQAVTLELHDHRGLAVIMQLGTQVR